MPSEDSSRTQTPRRESGDGLKKGDRGSRPSRSKSEGYPAKTPKSDSKPKPKKS